MLVLYGSLNKECQVYINDELADEILNDNRNSWVIFDTEKDAELFYKLKTEF